MNPSFHGYRAHGIMDRVSALETHLQGIFGEHYSTETTITPENIAEHPRRLPDRRFESIPVAADARVKLTCYYTGIDLDSDILALLLKSVFPNFSSRRVKKPLMSCIWSTQKGLIKFEGDNPLTNMHLKNGIDTFLNRNPADRIPLMREAMQLGNDVEEADAQALFGRLHGYHYTTGEPIP